MAEGAEVCRVDPARRDTGVRQLAPDSFGQVNSRPLWRLTELDCDFGSHFETALSDSGTDRRVQVLRTRVPARSHGFDGFRRDLGDGAAPAGVHGGYCAVALVRQQNR